MSDVKAPALLICKQKCTQCSNKFTLLQLKHNQCVSGVQTVRNQMARQGHLISFLQQHASSIDSTEICCRLVVLVYYSMLHLYSPETNTNVVNCIVLYQSPIMNQLYYIVESLFCTLDQLYVTYIIARFPNIHFIILIGSVRNNLTRKRLTSKQKTTERETAKTQLLLLLCVH